MSKVIFKIHRVADGHTINRDVSESKAPVKIRFVITQRLENQSYPIALPQKSILVDRPAINLPEEMDVESFWYQNDLYWINRETGYLFLLDANDTQCEPVGQLIERAPKEQRVGYPVSNTKIKWFMSHVT